MLNFMRLLTWTKRINLRSNIQRLSSKRIRLESSDCRCGINTNSSALTEVTKLFDRNVKGHLPQASLYKFSSISQNASADLDQILYEKVCEETLESLSEYFEELVENDTSLVSADVSYSSGVLTINFGEPHGTYVINRQSPNKQIWLSSPTSGPKRYDFLADQNLWYYKHDKRSLHQLLQEEISTIIKKNVDFSICRYSNLKK